ncbi:SEC-C metal-binding domain-containing protein [Cellulosimicrobium sp. SH8]|uniref:SEC-C metal-binding domain-containing protein n=1 Tax=Cellulosimicrobium sp. SH8 TaxID=2952936 RepID=UPI00399F52AE
MTHCTHSGSRPRATAGARSRTGSAASRARRNDPCWCGGPLKLKDCCALAPDASPSVLDAVASGCGHA